MIERMGVGMHGELMSLTPSDIDRFIGNDGWYRSNMDRHRGNGRSAAIETLQGYIRDLPRQPQRRSRRAELKPSVMPASFPAA